MSPKLLKTSKDKFNLILGVKTPCVQSVSKNFTLNFNLEWLRIQMRTSDVFYVNEIWRAVQESLYNLNFHHCITPFSCLKVFPQYLLTMCFPLQQPHQSTNELRCSTSCLTKVWETERCEREKKNLEATYCQKVTPGGYKWYYNHRHCYAGWLDCFRLSSFNKLCIIQD